MSGYTIVRNVSLKITISSSIRGIRQCLAQLLIDMKPHPDNHAWSMFPQKNVLKLQTIVNTGCIEENRLVYNSHL